MRLTVSLLAAAALIFILAPAALADSLQLFINSSVTANLRTPGDNYWGLYESWEPQSTIFPFVRNQPVDAVFSNVSLFLPTGSLIASATMDVLVPTSEISGTGFITIEHAFPPGYPDLPSIAPTSNGVGRSDVLVTYLGSHLVPAIINGNEVSTGNLNLNFTLDGRIYGGMLTPGSNWGGYIGGEGQVEIPYTVQLNVTYSPVPEPSSIALLGTGLLSLAGFARRKFLS